jgi:site-specific DNA-methyltransferase (adenine-specific)
MPESVTDRPTSSHEHVFLLAKSQRYFFDAEAVREPDAGTDHPRNLITPPDRSNGHLGLDRGIRTAEGRNGSGRNIRNVWSIATQPCAEAHFAKMPDDLAERCILAGCPVGGVVLDPFGGTGTVAIVADRLRRDAVFVDLNPEYAAMAARRFVADAGLFALVAAQ